MKKLGNSSSCTTSYFSWEFILFFMASLTALIRNVVLPVLGGPNTLVILCDVL